MTFPIHRPRRLRANDTMRRLVRENRVTVDDLVQPLFVVPGDGVAKEISSMPGQYRWPVERVAEEAVRIHEAGVPAIILFGIPESKDDQGTGAWIEDGVVQQAIRNIKREAPDLLVMGDVCLCEYTSHGHCGLITDRGVDNDSTLTLLARTALSQAHAGADIVAPSDMMDGRVGKIRAELDAAGFTNTAILSYAVKYSSAYYGPFRDAADSAPQFGDRKAYQMDPANAQEAIREAELDILEGADMLMVKPGTPYLDVLYRVKKAYGRPTGTYHVSGEYAMLEAAAANGWIDREKVILETLVSFKRAGADFILTYYAREAAEMVGKLS